MNRIFIFLTPHAMLIIRLIFLSLLVHCTFISKSYSQSLFQNGYLITNQNDTVRGFVKYEDWTNSPVEIAFKDTNGQVKLFSALGIRGFCIDAYQLKFKSKKIGLLNIALYERYRRFPSLKAKDSLQVFLKEIVYGSGASLYLYLNEVETSFYFLETKKGLVELYNYNIPMMVHNRTYIAVFDKYKEQLSAIAKESLGFNEPIPPYQEKYLRQYIEKYNSVLSFQNETSKPEQEIPKFDLDLNVGLENWTENPVILTNKTTFGLGMRVNFPGRFYNRFVKVNFFITPDANIGYDAASRRKVSLKTYEVSVGSHFGLRKLRPYIGFHYSGVSDSYRLYFLGFQAGLSYNRKINLELGHFANFISPMTGTTFFLRPRISLHYFVELNSHHKK
ncbi:hypothetical protein [Dyadobacter sp. CY326]|uniref:hypothetical protein n=1 Tax=Dyadobacter sp. CY326 TaxID=2907300 RepID=UPI001F28B8B1|nr:hypothetical protein [Dyadobacter sp. CY326]MCE7064876.1 hypothetical protein [Dyadobacter sp. CY326]